MGGAIPRQVVLACIRKQAEPVIRNKSVSSVPPRPLYQFLSGIPALTFLSHGPCDLGHISNKPFLPELLLVTVFIMKHIETMSLALILG